MAKAVSREILVLFVLYLPTFCCLTYEEAIWRAQCQAKCLYKHGSQETPPEYEVLEVYKPYSCQSTACDQCVTACQSPVSTVEDCEELCEKRSCKESCSYLRQLFTSAKTDVSTESIKVTAPDLYCQGYIDDSLLQERTFAYISWEALNGSEAADLPLVFVLSNNFLVVGLTTSTLAHFMNLSADQTYSLQVTAVAQNGIVSPLVSSQMIRISEDQNIADPPAGVRVEAGLVTTEGVNVVVSWRPGQMMSCFYSIYWMSTISGSQGYVHLEAPLPQWKYQITNLLFNENYTIRIYGYESSSRKTESLPAIVQYKTPDCLSSLNYNLSVCAPPTPKSFQAFRLPSNNSTSTDSVLLTWIVEEYAANVTYKLEYQLSPASVLKGKQSQPHHGELLLPQGTTNFTACILQPNQLYKFYLTAESSGGISTPAVVELFTGETKLPVQLYPENASNQTKGKRWNKGFIYIPLTGVVLSVIAAVIYRWYKSKKSFSIKNVSMIDLEYVSDYTDEANAVSLSSFTILSELGSGAFGKVMKAIVKDEAKLPPTLHKNMVVAIKVLKEQASRNSKSPLLTIAEMVRIVQVIVDARRSIGIV
ncbi:uncharacterized protein [Watersipora subatra]|uniref:uncharacterized protein n=1 Tax=Watersipora subatra TaxID=2589382 RepID=UPI00355BF987